MSKPANFAAYQVANLQRPVEVRPAPYPKPGKGEIVIRNAATAINPIDWILQSRGTGFAFQWLKYPFILGYDLAGEVAELGSGVTRFKVGDRVLAVCMGQNKERNRNEEAAFQNYVLVSDFMATPIPNSMTYEAASVVGLGLSTAAVGLFEKEHLGLDLPSVNAQPKGQVVVVWGGSTSVGLNAIQLAKAAGYEVITTVSPKNANLCRSLGASHTFDYKSTTVNADIIKELKGKTVAGALTASAAGADACFEILHKCKGKRLISMAAYPLPEPFPTSFVTPKVMYHFISWLLAAFFKSRLRGTKYSFIFGGSLTESGVGKAVFENWLGDALRDGSFKPAPEPMVVGKGLESIQEAMDIQQKGVSAKKVVVTL